MQVNENYYYHNLIEVPVNEVLDLSITFSTFIWTSNIDYSLKDPLNHLISQIGLSSLIDYSTVIKVYRVTLWSFF